MFDDFKPAPSRGPRTVNPTHEQAHRAMLHAAADEAHARLFDAMADLLDAISKSADTPDQWLRFRDAQADHKSACMALDEWLFAEAATREIAKQRAHLHLAERIIQHPITKEITS